MDRCFRLLLGPAIGFARHHQCPLPATIEGNGPVTRDQLIELWESIQRHSGEPFPGYRAGGFLQPAVWPALTELLVRCDSFKTAYRQLLHHQMNFASQPFLNLIEGDETITLEIQWPDLPESVRQCMEEYLVRCLAVLACWLRNPDQWIRRIELTRPDAGEVDSKDLRFLRYALGTKGSLKLAASGSRIVVDRAVYEAPLRAHQARPSTDSAGAQETMIEVIHRLIDEWVDDPALTRKKVAHAVHMSERTLQRCLGNAGTSYAELLKKARLNQARDRLRHSTDSIQVIAMDLGFSDPANFFRFFKRWEGTTPDQFRQRQRLASRLNTGRLTY